MSGAPPFGVGAPCLFARHKMTRAQAARHKDRFLAAFALHGNVSAACRAAGIARRTVYQWQEHDDDFAAVYRQAEVEATEVLEGEAFRRAFEGVKSEKGIYHQGAMVGVEHETKYSDTLLIFLLKARAPDKYRERMDVRHSGGVSVGDSLSPEQREEVRRVLAG